MNKHPFSTPAGMKDPKLKFYVDSIGVNFTTLVCFELCINSKCYEQRALFTPRTLATGGCMEFSTMGYKIRLTFSF